LAPNLLNSVQGQNKFRFIRGQEENGIQVRTGVRNSLAIA